MAAVVISPHYATGVWPTSPEVKNRLSASQTKIKQRSWLEQNLSVWTSKPLEQTAWWYTRHFNGDKPRHACHWKGSLHIVWCNWWWSSQTVNMQCPSSGGDNWQFGGVHICSQSVCLAAFAGRQTVRDYHRLHTWRPTDKVTCHLKVTCHS